MQCTLKFILLLLSAGTSPGSHIQYDNALTLPQPFLTYNVICFGSRVVFFLELSRGLFVFNVCFMLKEIHCCRNWWWYDDEEVFLKQWLPDLIVVRFQFLLWSFGTAELPRAFIQLFSAIPNVCFSMFNISSIGDEGTGHIQPWNCFFVNYPITFEPLNM